MQSARGILVLAPGLAPSTSVGAAGMLLARLEAEFAEISHEQHRLAARKAVLQTCLSELRLGDEARVVQAKLESRERRVDQIWPERA